LSIELIKPKKSTLIFTLVISLVVVACTLLFALDGTIRLRSRYVVTTYQGISLLGVVLSITSFCYLVCAPIVRRYFELNNGPLYFWLRMAVRVLLCVGFVMTFF
jgi:hypothetical protein